MSAKVDVQPGDRRLGWKVFGVLMIGALVGVWAVLPYSFALTGLPPSMPVPLWLLLAIGTLQNLVLFAALTGLGLWLGGKVGLGAPVLRAWLRRHAAGRPADDAQVLRRFRNALPVSIGAGAAVGLAIVGLDRGVFAPLLPTLVRETASPPPWQGLLASFYGGINEELLMRLGVMTLLVWVGGKIARRERPGAGVVWTANVLAALLFGAGHLPMTAALAPLTVVVVVRALLLNGVAGVVFGWFYWRRGLLAAMLCHFSADIVLHVIAAALSR